MSAVFTSLEQCQAALMANGFAVFVAGDMTCATTGRCHDCNSPQRIFNTWSIIDPGLAGWPNQGYPDRGRVWVVRIR